MGLYLGKEKINNLSVGQAALGITDISDKTTINISGILKGENNKIVSATAGVDYVIPSNLNNFITQDNLNLKANIDSPNFTGTPLAPTPNININNTQIATTEFVNLLIDSKISAILNQAYYGAQLWKKRYISL